MNLVEFEFCDEYETRIMEFNLLKILEKELTDKGRKIFDSKKKWLEDNLDMYLKVTNK